MSAYFSRFTALTAVLLLGTAAASAVAGEVLVHPVPPPGAIQSAAYYIDESGRLGGIYSDGGGTKIFLSDGTGFTDVLPPGATSSNLNDMNNNMEVLGNAWDGLTTTNFHYDGGVFTAIPLPPTATSHSPLGLSDGGQITGYAWYPAGPNPRGWLLDGGVFTEILPPGALSSYAQDVNSSGDVVGQYSDSAGSRAFLYSGGAFSDPSPPGWTETVAYRINEGGTILGLGFNGTTRQCFLNRGGTISIVAGPGSSWTECQDISENDTVVGFTESGYGQQSFVYRDGALQLLEARDGTPFLAWDINSDFEVAGVKGSRMIRAVMATEPQGAAGVAGVRRIPGDSAAVAAGEVDNNGIPINDIVAVRGSLLPSPQIRTGQDAMVEGNYAPKYSLLPWAYAGMNVEWWVVAQTPTRTYSYDIASGTWVPGFFPSFTGPLRRMPERVLPPAGFDLGIYTYYFGVDFLVNGIVDPKFLVYEGKTVLNR